MGKNVNRHFSQNFYIFDIFLLKMTDLNANTSITVAFPCQVGWGMVVSYHNLCSNHNTTAVASNRPTQALALVIFFHFCCF